MKPGRDLPIFLVSVLGWSILLAAVLWLLPRVNYNPSDALILIASASVILSARGASWGRRALFAGGMLGAFLVVDAAFLVSGSMRWAFAGLTVANPIASVVAITYVFFAQALPFLVLLLFVGRNPSILWTSKPAARR